MFTKNFIYDSNIQKQYLLYSIQNYYLNRLSTLMVLGITKSDNINITVINMYID